MGMKVRSGAEPDQAGERRHHRADAGEEAADEDADGAEAEIFALDHRQRAWREQAAAGRRSKEPAPVPSRGEVDARGAKQIGAPGDEENQQRRRHAAAGEKGAERHRGVGGNGRDDVLDRGEEGEDGVDGRGGELRDPREQGLDQQASSSATAMTASPSPRPMNPIPSFVLAFTLIAPAVRPSRWASAAPMAPRWGASLGSSVMTVRSACARA